MSNGRYTMRGRATQGRAFAAFALASSSQGATDYVTTRFTLIGTSRQRLNMIGTSQQMIDITGASQERLTIKGSNG